jgi:hypothetical protein
VHFNVRIPPRRGAPSPHVVPFRMGSMEEGGEGCEVTLAEGGNSSMMAFVICDLCDVC